MCGICGFVGSAGDKENILQNMMDRIVHRGPDDEGKYINGDAALGFRRLSIIDLSNGSQPMFNEDKSMVIVFNGEIYNYESIKKELISKGHVFSNNADTECLIHAYEEYGEDMLSKLRGMFAFAIWDEKNETLFGARDFFGIKPFYYGIVDGNLLFGSEIKSFLDFPGFEKQVNEEALEQYLSFQYSAIPETFFKGIYKLAPGHSLKFKKGDLTIKQYWSPDLEPEEGKSIQTTKEEIKEVLEDSVAAHMIADVEVGTFLSSGVDSSYITAQSPATKTFTVGFEEGQGQYNEISYAKDLSGKLGKDGYNKVITADEFWGCLPKVMYHMDEPSADAAAVALYFVDQLAAEHVKVALSGEGADELFGGYNIYHEPISLRHYQKIPVSIRKVLREIVELIPFDFKGKNFLIRGSMSVEERFIGNAYVFKYNERNKILKNPATKKAPDTVTKPFYRKAGNVDDVAKMQTIDLNFWLPGDILLKADKMSMAHSLETRVPYLDKEVFKVARELPQRYKVNQTTTKFVFRETVKEKLPEATASKKKLGFPVPIRVWLREAPYYSIIKKAFTSEAANKYFNTGELLNLLDEHYIGKKDNNRKIWTVYAFLLWYDVFFNEDSEAAKQAVAK